jgi:hypothetical protein
MTRSSLRRLAFALVALALVLLVASRFRDGVDDAVDAPLTANAAAIATGLLVAGVMLAALSRRPRH